LLFRWYASLDSLAALTAVGHIVHTAGSDPDASHGDESAEGIYLDDRMATR